MFLQKNYIDKTNKRAITLLKYGHMHTVQMTCVGQ